VWNDLRFQFLKEEFVKRFSWLVAGCMIAGCSHSADQSAKPAADATAPTASAPTTMPSAAKPANAPIFELSQDGKIYVFGSVDDLTAFQNGKTQPMQVEKPELNPGHRPVVLEAVDDAETARLCAAYAKLHPIAK